MSSNLNIYFFILSLVIVIGFIIFIWTHKITPEERKRITERTKPKVYHKVEEEKKENNLKDESSYSIVGFVIIAVLSFIYFYKVWTDPQFTLGFIGYFLIIIFIVGSFVTIVEFFKSENKYQQNLKELNNNKDTNIEYPATSFDNFIAGRMSLAKCFWLYFMFFGIIISVISGYIFELGHPIVLIIPVAYYIIISISLWNCATLYTKHKLENKQTYGWAIAAKILICINAFVLVGQTILILNLK